MFAFHTMSTMMSVEEGMRVCHNSSSVQVAHVDNRMPARDDRLSLLEFLSRHASIRGAIMENRNKAALRRESNEADKVMEVEAEHTRWWNTVDEYLSEDEGTQNISKAHQVTLIVLRFESVLALHRSLLATSKKNSAYNAALQRCISASRSIINTLHKAIKGFGAFDGSPGQRGYESTPLLWPSFTWAVWMSIFIIIFAASEGQFARETALRLAERSVQILQHLSLRGTNWPEACIVAVQNLSTRLREGSTPASGTHLGLPNASASSTIDSRVTSVRTSQDDYMNMGGLEQRRSGQVTPQGTAMMPPRLPQNIFSQSLSMSQNPMGSTGAYHIPEVYAHVNNANNAYLGGVGTFLGIAQQSSDNPIPNDEIMHLFNAEDMGFWIGDNSGYGGNFALQEGDLH
jgi:hypothetical protein